MERKIFLKGYESKNSVNTSEGLNVQLKGNKKLLPLNDFSAYINEYEQYTKERTACNKIRLTCQVNPICSNVLFNNITEIVKDEGSSSVSFINYGIINGAKGTTATTVSDGIKYKDKRLSFWSGNNFSYRATEDSLTTVSNDSSKQPTNAIRDTQLSSLDYVYHCGRDIFNNHLLRSKTFKCVCKLIEGDESQNRTSSSFNTIADYMRDVKGNKVIESVVYPQDANVEGNKKDIMIHTYEYDDILEYNEAVSDKLAKRNDGWFGFYNTSKIKTYENFRIGEELSIERPIMYKNGGDFVDMYPTRDLYSFVPKWNTHRKRIEKNWNYCITYPSSSITEGFDEILEMNEDTNALKVIYFDENTRSDNGSTLITMYSISKHGLKEGDFVNIYKTVKIEEGNDERLETIKVLDNAEVNAVVDDYIFTVFNGDTQISSEWRAITDEEFSAKTFIFDGITYKIDISNDFVYEEHDEHKEKRYYIVNERYVNIEESLVSISYKKVVNDIECDYYVRIFSKLPNFKFASADTSNQYEIYKNNGKLIDEYQDKEYDFENHISRLAFAKNIYSDEVGQVVFTDDINIDNLKDNLGRPLSSLYITFVKNNKGYKEWYGFDNVDVDVTSENVEFSHCFGKVTCGLEMSEESKVDLSLRNVHLLTYDEGFNVGSINNNHYSKASSNEVWFDSDKHFYGDLCCYDNYNARETSIQPFMHRFNTAQRETVSATTSATTEFFKNYLYDNIEFDDYDTTSNYQIKSKLIGGCNDKKEGYYYNPHYEIPIKTFGSLSTAMPDFLTILSITTGNTITISTSQRHFLTIGDKAVLFNYDNNEYYYLMVINGTENNEKRFICHVYDEKGNAKKFDGVKDNCKLFKIDNLDIPSYARVLKDGTCRLIWRDIINNGIDETNKSIEKYPFTNGAFYINKKIDIYVRRQDPYDIWGLYDSTDTEGEYYDKEDYFVKENNITEC